MIITGNVRVRDEFQVEIRRAEDLKVDNEEQPVVYFGVKTV